MAPFVLDPRGLCRLGNFLALPFDLLVQPRRRPIELGIVEPVAMGIREHGLLDLFACSPPRHPAQVDLDTRQPHLTRSEEHTSELQSLMRISYAGLCLEKQTNTQPHTNN